MENDSPSALADALARPALADALARRFARALAMTISHFEDRGDAGAGDGAPGGLVAAQRALAEAVVSLVEFARRVEATLSADPRSAAAGAALLTSTAADIRALAGMIRSIEAPDSSARRRILAILRDPLAERWPRAALALCAEPGASAEFAIKVLRTAAIHGAIPLSPDPGGARLQ